MKPRLSSRRLIASLAAVVLPLATIALFLVPTTSAGASVGKGTLTCPAGTTLSGGQCEAPAQAACPSGATQSGNTCTATPSCPAGLSLFTIPGGPFAGYQVCTDVPFFTTGATPSCPSGTSGLNPQSIPGPKPGQTTTGITGCSGPSQTTCPSGTSQQGGVCVAPATRVCPTGESAIPEDPKFCAPNENLALNQEIRDEALGEGGTTDGSFTPDGGGGGFNVDNFVPGNGGSIDNFIPGGG